MPIDLRKPVEGETPERAGRARRVPRWAVVSVALLGLAGLVAASVAIATSGGDGERQGPSGPSEREAQSPPQGQAPPAGQAPPQAQPSAQTSSGYAPQPERRFIRVGTNNGQQFSDEELRFLADNFDVVLLTKFHGGWDITAQHEAARRLVEMKPGIEVYPYFSTKYWFEQNRWDGAVVDPAWILRDQDGKVVDRDRRRDRDRPTDITYVDLANPSYRAWASGVLASWLAAAPYAGISFDAAEPIGDFGEKDVTRWAELLGPERVAAYNAGMRALLASASELVGPDREVVFNGIAPSQPRGPNRNLDLLQVTDGALDERFCLDVRGQVRGVQADLDLLTQPPAGKRLFLRTNYLDSFDPSQRARYERFCLGVFLLGWQPGQSYFQFGGDYTAEQLGSDPPDLKVNLGRPAGADRVSGELRQRPFENGSLYVNVGANPAKVVLDEPLTEVQGGRVVATHGRGDTVTVPPGDAAFLLRTDRG